MNSTRTDLPILDLRSLEKGVRWLRRRDPELGEWIDRIGRVGLRRHRHRFSALLRSIVSQQLSAKAAATIWKRLSELLGPGAPRPRRLLEIDAEQLRACGLSNAKTRYVRALAEAFESGPLHRARLADRSDEEVIKLLTQVPGIGVWTAEMFLIFGLGRIDIFSIGDLALRNAVCRVVGRELDAGAIESHAERWSPYRSVASLYLWRIAHWK